jgi:hypothetical protein
MCGTQVGVLSSEALEEFIAMENRMRDSDRVATRLAETLNSIERSTRLPPNVMMMMMAQ